LKENRVLPSPLKTALRIFKGRACACDFLPRPSLPIEKRHATALLIENLAVSNSACFAFFFGRLITPIQPPHGRFTGHEKIDILKLQLNIPMA